MAEWTAKCPRRTGNTGIERVRPAAARSDPAQHQTQPRVRITVDHFGASRSTAAEPPPLAYPAASCPSAARVSGRRGAAPSRAAPAAETGEYADRKSTRLN